MKIQPQQNTAFGAIKIKCAKNFPQGESKANAVARANFLPLHHGITWLGNRARYIMTKEGSNQELQVLTQLKNLFKNSKGVSISKTSNWRAQRSIDRQMETWHGSKP